LQATAVSMHVPLVHICVCVYVCRLATLLRLRCPSPARDIPIHSLHTCTPQTFIDYSTQQSSRKYVCVCILCAL